MKTLVKILKWTGIVVVAILVVFAITVGMLQNRKFDAAYPEVKISKDPAVIARGKAIVYGPAHCAYCHTATDQFTNVEKGEILPLSGGHVFELPVGKIYSRNLTSDMETGIGKLTDAEIARTLRYGVGSDGRAVLDFMPFQHMSEDDLNAVISFLRTQQPVHNEVPKNDFNLLGKIVSALIIKPVSPSQDVPQKIEEAPTVEYGKYLALSVANCRGCHTLRDMRTGAYTGQPFAGGLKMESELAPGTFLTTPNLTPDPETGKITGWSLQQFKERFRQGRLIPASYMPWGPFSRMSDVQLEAIYKYLKTLAPIKNEIGPIVSNKPD